jgi:hypothetical protein
MAKVFISYAHYPADQSVARRLHGDLKRHGIEPWLDEIDLMPGRVWRDEIGEAIRASDYFIALLSRQSLNKRGYVQRELKAALTVLGEMPHGTTFLIPVRLDDCSPTNPRITKLQWLNLFPDYEAGLPRLLRALDVEDPGSSASVGRDRTPAYAHFGIAIPPGISSWPESKILDWIGTELETEARNRAERDYYGISLRDPAGTIRHRTDEKMEEVAASHEFLPTWHKYLRQRNEQK